MKLVNIKNSVNGYNSGNNWYVRDTLSRSSDLVDNISYTSITGDSSGRINWVVSENSSGSSYIYEFTKEGTLLLSKKGLETNLSIKRIFTAPSGNVYIVSTKPTVYTSFIVTKLDSSLNVLWSKTINVSITYYVNIYCHSISVKPDESQLFVCMDLYDWNANNPDRGFVTLNTTNGSIIQGYRVSTHPFPSGSPSLGSYNTTAINSTSSNELYMLAGYVNGTSNVGGKVCRIPYSDLTLVDWTSTKSISYGGGRRMVPMASNLYSGELYVCWVYTDSVFGLYIDKINTTTGAVVAGNYLNVQTSSLSGTKFNFDSSGNIYIVNYTFDDVNLNYYVYIFKVTTSMVIAPVLRLTMPSNWVPKRAVGSEVIGNKIYVSLFGHTQTGSGFNGNTLFSFDLNNLPPDGQFGEVVISKTFPSPYTTLATVYNSTFNGDPGGLSSEYSTTSSNYNDFLISDGINTSLNEFST